MFLFYLLFIQYNYVWHQMRFDPWNLQREQTRILAKLTAEWPKTARKWKQSRYCDKRIISNKVSIGMCAEFACDHQFIVWWIEIQNVQIWLSTTKAATAFVVRYSGRTMYTMRTLLSFVVSRTDRFNQYLLELLSMDRSIPKHMYNKSQQRVNRIAWLTQNPTVLNYRAK